MRPKLFFAEIAQEGDFPVRIRPRDLSKVFDTPDYAAWKGLRDQDDSIYVGLCMPRVLSRLPYGAKTEPVE